MGTHPIFESDFDCLTEKMSFYTVLNLETGCSLGEIKSAYKHLARLHHPDKSGNEDQFKQIALAYATLSDSDKRCEYDERIGLTRIRPLGHQVEFDEFETDSEDEEFLSFHCQRCTGKYLIGRDEMDDNVTLEIQCSDCSLFILTSGN